MVNTNYSGIVPVTDPAEVRTLQSPPLVMPDDGYFYTFLTNSSQTMVEFNDLTIRHKQGVILAHYDYYAYGLMWSDPELGNIHDQTYQSREWNQNEFGDSGMDLYRFEARMCDPVIGRWTSLDPAQQFFNNYIAMSNDPANHVDLDGRWSWACFTEGFAATNSSGVFNGIGDMLSVYSAAKSIQSLSQISDASINLGMSTALTNAKAVVNQVATAMAGGGVGDRVTHSSTNSSQNNEDDYNPRLASRDSRAPVAPNKNAFPGYETTNYPLKEEHALTAYIKNTSDPTYGFVRDGDEYVEVIFVPDLVEDPTGNKGYYYGIKPNVQQTSLGNGVPFNVFLDESGNLTSSSITNINSTVQATIAAYNSGSPQSKFIPDSPYIQISMTNLTPDTEQQKILYQKITEHLKTIDTGNMKWKLNLSFTTDSGFPLTTIGSISIDIICRIYIFPF